MTSTEKIKKPEWREVLACDSLYTALLAVRRSERFVRSGVAMDVQRQLHAVLTAAFRGHGGASDLVMAYLDAHPSADVIEAVDQVFEGWSPVS